MNVTTETKAVLLAETGRVVGFVKSNEPGKISIAVPAERAVMTPAQARQLAAWLIEEADNVHPTDTVAARAARQYSADEAKRQAVIRDALNQGLTSTGRFRRAY
ncbi:hypothetical protein [Streptomyces sp. NPDC005166]